MCNRSLQQQPPLPLGPPWGDAPAHFPQNVFGSLTDAKGFRCRRRRRAQAGLSRFVRCTHQDSNCKCSLGAQRTNKQITIRRIAPSKQSKLTNVYPSIVEMSCCFDNHSESPVSCCFDTNSESSCQNNKNGETTKKMKISLRTHQRGNFRWLSASVRCVPRRLLQTNPPVQK